MTSYVKSVLSIVSSALQVNAATFSGAMDIIAVQDEEGNLQSTHFHARFGKLRLLKSREKVVQVEVNGELHPEIQMRLGSAGEAYFIEETDEIPPEDLCPSPASMPSSPKMIAYETPIEPLLNGKRKGSLHEAEEKTLDGEDDTSFAVNYLSDSEVDKYNKIDNRRRSMLFDGLLDEIGSSVPIAGTREHEESIRKTDEGEDGGDEDQNPEKMVSGVITAIVSAVVNNGRVQSPTSARLKPTGQWMNSESNYERPAGPMETLELPPAVTSLPDGRGQDALAAVKLSQRHSKDHHQSRSTDDEQDFQVSSPISQERSDYEVDVEGSGGMADANHQPQRRATPTSSGKSPKEPSRSLYALQAEIFGEHAADLEFEQPVLTMSLCGHLVNPDMEEQVVTSIFEEHRVNYEEFAQNPSLLHNPKLLLRMRDRILHWEIAAPMIVSMLAFGIPLDIDRLEKATARKEREEQAAEDTTSSISRLLGFSRRKKSAGDQIVMKEPILGEYHHVPQLPAPPGMMKKKKHVRKSLRPTPEMLKKLNLKPGRNSIRFIVYSSLQGQQEVSASIFLWSSDRKIVISDVDGTITRSDVLGHLLPRMGRDWSHAGVVDLFHKLVAMGYSIMYLTSRPIGQAASTRAYLSNLVQGEQGLPEGPIVMSPDRLIRSFTREVILKKPHEFKIAALTDIRKLFPESYNPFYAGFGNRDTDVISYGAVGIPAQRIFTINPKGELNIMNARYEACGSYNDLKRFVRSVFPDIKGFRGQKNINEVLEYSGYNDFNYWKAPLPVVNLDDLF